MEKVDEGKIPAVRKKTLRNSCLFPKIINQINLSSKNSINKWVSVTSSPFTTFHIKKSLILASMDDDKIDDETKMNEETSDTETSKPEKLFTLKKWNAVAYWSWDCSSDTCAICRVQVSSQLDVFL